LCYDKFHYAILNDVLMIILKVIMLSVIMLKVILWSFS
jgi:hypothetical protein